MTHFEGLIQAYNENSLNQISGQLIQAYKNKNSSLILSIAQACSIMEEESTNRLFTKIIQLYHPDKSVQIIKEIKEKYEFGQEEELQKYHHIFKTQDLLSNKIVTAPVEVELNTEVVWEESEKNDYQFFYDTEPLSEDEQMDHENEDKETQKSSYNFYEAIQLRELGDLNSCFPSYYLEDLDELELSSSHISSLEGAQFCKHAQVLDLSDNLISDLSELWDLNRLTELYLANNQLSYIDALANLTELKTLDLSYNQITDIGPLLLLNQLEYVNLIGNPLSRTDIELLKFKEIHVIC